MRRYFSVAGGLAWRLLHSLVTNPLLFLPPMLMPLFFFTAFAGGLSAVSKVPGFDYGPGYTSFIFAFVLCQSAAFGGVFSGFSIAADFQFGFGRRLLLATPHRSALVLGYGVVALIRAAITITVVTLVGLLVGMNIGGSGLDLFGMYGLAAIINVTGLLFAAGVALRFRSLQATPLMQVPVFLFLFLAPVYVPRQLLGGWVHAVAPFNPATHVMETARDLIAGQGADYLATLGDRRRRCSPWSPSSCSAACARPRRPASSASARSARVGARPLGAVGDELARRCRGCRRRSGSRARSRPGTAPRRAASGRAAGQPPQQRREPGAGRVDRAAVLDQVPRGESLGAPACRRAGGSPRRRPRATGRTVRRRSQASTLPRHQRQKPQSES